MAQLQPPAFALRKPGPGACTWDPRAKKAEKTRSPGLRVENLAKLVSFRISEREMPPLSQKTQ